MLKERKHIEVRPLQTRWPQGIKTEIGVGRFQAITKDICIREKVFIWLGNDYDRIESDSERHEKIMYEFMALKPLRLSKALDTWLSLVEVKDKTLTIARVPFGLFK